jgi:hypothetical protein
MFTLPQLALQNSVLLASTQGTVTAAVCQAIRHYDSNFVYHDTSDVFSYLETPQTLLTRISLQEGSNNVAATRFFHRQFLASLDKADQPRGFTEALLDGPFLIDAYTEPQLVSAYFDRLRELMLPELIFTVPQKSPANDFRYGEGYDDEDYTQAPTELYGAEHAPTEMFGGHDAPFPLHRHGHVQEPPYREWVEHSGRPSQSFHVDVEPPPRWKQTLSQFAFRFISWFRSFTSI